jgi:bifunctional oligoribonuclease and PAP phosphatase NrnA
MTDTRADAPSSDAWTSNATLDQIASHLRGKRRVVVLTHVKPDGDAIGSTLAVVRTLNAMRGLPPDVLTDDACAQAWYFGPKPTFYDRILRGAPATNYEHRSHPGGEPDAVVILDTGSWQQLEQVRDWLEPRADRAVVIDHHRQGDAATGARRHIDTSAAAACQLAAELCRRLLGLDSIARLPRDIAQACYLGLATDTGWFRHSNVTPEVFRTAAHLLEAGVDAAELYRVVEQCDREARVRLRGRALTGMRLHDEGRFALMSITRRDLAETGAEMGDAGGFADDAQVIESVRVVAMFTESEPDAQGRPVTKVSLRSKEAAGGVDVNQVGRRFGGGGHMRAAGARIAAPIDEAMNRVLAALREAPSA